MIPVSINGKRYDAFDMSSVAEFGALKDRMSFWFKSGDTLFYDAGDMTITVSGDFAPLTGDDPRNQYSPKTIVESIQVFDRGNEHGWHIFWSKTITFGDFYTARTVDQLLGMSAVRDIGGTFYSDNLLGGNADDTIRGNEGDDTIRGRGGYDLIEGGAGNDLLFGDSGDDVLRDSGGSNTLDGGTGNDEVNGGAGVDRIVGGTGNDFLSGGGGVDSITGDDGDDLLVGGTGGDALAGGTGNDRLNGGTGADQMHGGLGDDVFYVDATADKTFEAASQGADIVYSSVSYTLAAGQHVETLATTALAGTGAINLAGNELAQKIVGNNGNNTLTGNGGADVLYGYAGNDRLNGGAGADQMYGGLGDDVFYVDIAADKVFETANQGTDTVLTSVSYALVAGQHIERLATTLITGTAAIRLMGNEFNQSIAGNNGANVIAGGGGNDVLAGYGGNDTLDGGIGNDVLYGGTGNDTLTGGAGYDYFAFNTTLSPTTNVDRIIDFNIPQDTIRLDNAVMAGLGPTLGTLSAAKFWKSPTGTAHDADDRIIYETDTGRLFYDSNGIGAGGSVHFATLAPNLALTNADFAVI